MVMPCGSSTGSPSSTMLPRSGLSRRISRRATVDLPQPDSPTTPRVSPLATDRLRSSTARTTLVVRPSRAARHREMLAQARRQQQRLGRAAAIGNGDQRVHQAFTSMAARSPSLIRLKQIEVMKIITPGSAASTGLT